MKMIQEPLFELPPEREIEKGNRWYYIINPHETLMLIMRDAGVEWADHDTQHVVPHLFNSAATARKFLRDQKFTGSVKRYPYTEQWWK